MHQSSLSADYRDQYNGIKPRGTQIHNSSVPPLMGSGSLQSGVNTNSESAAKGTTQANAPPKKPKRRVNSLVQAAKQRRRETEYQNYHHPPAPEDIWICEFCEYERIFGRAPEALIRQYEIKDRRRRREEAERRRLLEKAKMKSRKGKRANRVPAKNNSNAPDRHNASSSGQQGQPSQEDQTPHQDQEENGYDSEDHCEHQSPNGGIPRLIPTIVHTRDSISVGVSGVGPNGCFSH